jgi:hypothetical protein
MEFSELHYGSLQTLIPIGTFGEKARKLLGKVGLDDVLEFLTRRPMPGQLSRVREETI